jgi:hypothetical protein
MSRRPRPPSIDRGIADHIQVSDTTAAESAFFAKVRDEARAIGREAVFAYASAFMLYVVGTLLYASVIALERVQVQLASGPSTYWTNDPTGFHPAALALHPEEAWLALTVLSAIIIALNLIIASLSKFEADGSGTDESDFAVKRYARTAQLIVAARTTAIISAIVGISAFASVSEDSGSPISLADLGAIVVGSFVIVRIALDSAAAVDMLDTNQSAWRRARDGARRVRVRNYIAQRTSSRGRRPYYKLIAFFLATTMCFVLAGNVGSLGPRDFEAGVILSILYQYIPTLLFSFTMTALAALDFLALFVLFGLADMGFLLIAVVAIWDIPSPHSWSTIVKAALFTISLCGYYALGTLWVFNRTWLMKRGDLLPFASSILAYVLVQYARRIERRFEKQSFQPPAARLLGWFARWWDRPEADSLGH